MIYFFTELFYILGLIFIAHEMKVLTNPTIKITQDILKELWKESPDNKLARDVYVKTIAIEVYYFLWSIIGLFTMNWVWFWVLTFLGSVYSYVKKKLTEPLQIIQLIQIDAAFSLFVLLTILYNHFIR